MTDQPEGRLWGGRFSDSPDEAAWALGRSTQFDVRLWPDDLAGSAAHAHELHRIGLLTAEELDSLLGALRLLESDFASGQFRFERGDEDLHGAVERRLIDLVGDAGRRLRAGRSRNDQIAGDLKRYLRRVIADDILPAVRGVQAALCDVAEEVADWIALSVVVNKQNDFAQDVTLEELNTMWEPAAEGKIKKWNQVRDSWPAEPLNLYGAGTQSGTFDFFTEFVNGEEGASRSDYQASEDDNVLVQGIQGDENALGYFGYSYYAENQDTLRALAVDDVEPNPETIASGEYPLSRPLFIYVNTQDLKENPAVREFVEFYIAEGNLSKFVEQADYINYPDSTQEQIRQQFEDRTTGTIYTEQGELPGGDIESALKQSK